jgi:hypothetical protein
VTCRRFPAICELLDKTPRKSPREDSLKLRFPADRRTLLWMFGLMPGSVALQFARPALVP